MLCSLSVEDFFRKNQKKVQVRKKVSECSDPCDPLVILSSTDPYWLLEIRWYNKVWNRKRNEVNTFYSFQVHFNNPSIKLVSINPSTIYSIKPLSGSSYFQDGNKISSHSLIDYSLSYPPVLSGRPLLERKTWTDVWM